MMAKSVNVIYSAQKSMKVSCRAGLFQLACAPHASKQSIRLRKCEMWNFDAEHMRVGMRHGEDVQSNGIQ